jgi:hypothetical protein
MIRAAQELFAAMTHIAEPVPRVAMPAAIR